jgi:hypothetical protein
MITSKYFLSLAMVLFSGTVSAHIPSTTLILQRAAETSGAGSYTIDLELNCTSADSSFTTREVWTIMSDGSMSVIATGTQDLKGKYRYSANYQGSNKIVLTSSGKTETKLNEDFVEKYHHIRDINGFTSTFVKMGVLSPSNLQRKVLKKVEDYKPETNIRLARVGGGISYAFGEPSTVEKTTLPAGLWIEQDQFFLRKVRTPHQAEILVETPSTFARGFVYPRTRSLKWGNNSCTISTNSVVGRSNSGGLKLEPSENLIESSELKSFIDSFYLRFR